MAISVIVLLSLLHTSVRAQKCEEWCKHACEELNGDLDQECGGCDTSDPAYTCHANAPDFATWRKRVGTTANELSDEPLYASHEGKENIGAFEYHELHEHELGVCEFETIIDHKDVNRTWLLNHGKPVLIRGATEGWLGRERWRLESMLANYGNSECVFAPAQLQRLIRICVWSECNLRLRCHCFPSQITWSERATCHSAVY